MYLKDNSRLLLSIKAKKKGSVKAPIQKYVDTSLVTDHSGAEFNEE